MTSNNKKQKSCCPGTEAIKKVDELKKVFGSSNLRAWPYTSSNTNINKGFETLSNMLKEAKKKKGS